MSEPETVSPDLNSIPMVDLENLVNRTEPTIADDPVVEVEDEPEPVEQTEEQETPEEKQPEETKPEAAPEAEKAPEDAIPEHIRLRMEATELERKKFEALAGRHAGELGFLKNKLRDLEEKLNARGNGEAEYAAPEENAPAPSKGQDRFAKWAVQQALNQTINAFSAQYPDANDLAPDIVTYMQSNGIDLAKLSETSDPISASEETRTALELAYLHVATAKKQEAAAKAEQEAARRSADEVKTLSARRKAVAATPTGGVRAAVPSKNQDPRTMPLKDLSRMIENMGAGSE